MEKMGALTQINIHIGKGRFDDYFCVGYLAPYDRNTQPWIRATPATEADQQVRPFRLDWTMVDPLQLGGNQLVEFRFVSLGLDKYDIRDLLGDPVA